jgi:sensor histidine kinase regulating citrate/malate metabolism
MQLVGGIGEGQMKQEIERKVMSIVKSQSAALAQETGVRPSIEDRDITQYLEQVTKEIKRSKTTA